MLELLIKGMNMNLKNGIFNEIDQIINIDIMGRRNRELYSSAKKPTPLCLEAAKIINKSIMLGSSVFIASGFPIIPNIKPETDGPIGAIVLAKALEKLNVRTFFITDDLSKELHSALVRKTEVKNSSIICIPAERSAAIESCKLALMEHKPSLLIAVERPGINQHGIYCNMNGDDISPYVGKIDYMFKEAHEKNIPTIGVGDGGNEIGMGNIYEDVAQILPLGSIIASKTRTTSLVVSAVSNWGIYGIVAALSILKGFSLMHNSTIEKMLIETCIKSGAVDGISKTSSYSVDGIPSDFHGHIVDILNFITVQGISKKDSLKSSSNSN